MYDTGNHLNVSIKKMKKKKKKSKHLDTSLVVSLWIYRTIFLIYIFLGTENYVTLCFYFKGFEKLMEY